MVIAKLWGRLIDRLELDGFTGEHDSLESLKCHLADRGRSVSTVSIDGIELREFDYVDVGELIPSSGAVPVVIKSLVFPGSA